MEDEETRNEHISPSAKVLSNALLRMTTDVKRRCIYFFQIFSRDERMKEKIVKKA